MKRPSRHKQKKNRFFRHVIIHRVILVWVISRWSRWFPGEEPARLRREVGGVQLSTVKKDDTLHSANTIENVRAREFPSPTCSRPSPAAAITGLKNARDRILGHGEEKYASRQDRQKAPERNHSRRRRVDSFKVPHNPLYVLHGPAARTVWPCCGRLSETSLGLNSPRSSL